MVPARCVLLVMLVGTAACGPPLPLPPRPPVPQAPGAYMAGGTVVGVERASPDDPVTHVHIVIQPAHGSPFRVDLGPGWYLDQHGLRFSERDVLEVEGRTESRDGGDVLVARKIRKDGKTFDLPARDSRP